MKKFFMVAALTLIGVLMLASTALAIKAPFVHGDFASSSKGCGDCHTTHSAGAQKLLNTTYSTQTAFCIGCHGKTSPFDVKYGRMVTDAADAGTTNLATRFSWDATDTTVGANTRFSYAGGFMKSLNFNSKSTDPATSADSTSVHNVRGLDSTGAAVNLAGVSTYGFLSADTIPGGTGSLDFECGSCHDPHAGGVYDDGNRASKNPRLLKEVILGSAVKRVNMHFGADNLPTAYDSGINEWCGTCHNTFDTSALATTYYGSAKDQTAQNAARTGYNLIGGRTKYMHLMGVTVDDTKSAAGFTTPYNIKYLALDATKKLTCLTCHRAHGSSANTDNITWTRYAAYANGAAGTTTTAGTGSALLRLPERDVCYACHGAATLNHDQTH